MADKDESRSIFDFTIEELAKVSSGDPVSASHLNKIVDAINKGRIGVGSAEQIVRTSPGGSIDFGIIRGWPDPLGDLMDVSLISRNSATGTWLIQSAGTVEVVCSPGLRAKDYEAVQWIAPGGEGYPLALPRQLTVLAQPIVTVGSDLVAMWLPSIVVPDPLPADLPVSDGYVNNGAGEVSFVSP